MFEVDKKYLIYGHLASFIDSKMMDALATDGKLKPEKELYYRFRRVDKLAVICIQEQELKEVVKV